MEPVYTQAELDAYAKHIKDHYFHEWKGTQAFDVTFMKGPKYTRVVTGSMGSRSAHSFVENATGLIWKPAGFAGPTKNFSRGNVKDPVSYKNVRWTGV